MSGPKEGMRWRIALLLALCLAVGCPPYPTLGGPAWAQDDDDDGGDDDDDGGGGAVSGGGGGGAPPGKPKTPRTVRRPAPASAPVLRALPDRAPDEIVVTGLSEADFIGLTGEGFGLIERQSILTNGPEVLRLRIPPALSLTEARDRVRARPTGGNADFNHYYRQGEAPVPAALPAQPAQPAPCAHLNCEAQALIGWPVSRPPTCRVTQPVAVIDTGINPDHAGLAAAEVELARLTEEAAPESSVVHGTAVLSLLVGHEPRAPGLVPEAPVLAIDVFTNAGGDQRADVVSLVRALDLAVQRGVRVANLSLAGPENAVLTDMLGAVEVAGVLVVAAAGNAGPTAPPAWPAAHAGALAVTAVDPGGRIYRKAQRGPHVDIAAPGVEVWAAASVKGVKPRTGTSYAAPHVTAAAAILASRHPDWTPADLAAALRAMTVDAGAKGADEVFGAGILSVAALCGASAE